MPIDLVLRVVLDQADGDVRCDETGAPRHKDTARLIRKVIQLGHCTGNWTICSETSDYKDCVKSRLGKVRISPEGIH